MKYFSSLLMFFLLVCIPFFAPHASSTDALTAFSMGYYFLYNDDLKKAKAQFESCVKLENDPPAILYTLLSEVADMLGQKDEAEEYSTKALEINPDDETALQFKALFLIDREAYEEAMPYLERLREKTPRNLQVLLSIAEVYGNLEKEDRLIDVYRDILLIRPDFVDVRLNLGYLYSKKGLLNRAKDQYERVLENDPENEKAIFYLTYIYLSEGNTERALFYFQKLENKELLNDEMLEDYAANLFVENQNPGPALSRISKKENTGPVTRGIELFINGDLDGAKSLFESGIQEDDNNIAAYVGLIRIAEKKGNIDMEKKWRFVLAGVLHELHNYEKALEESRRVREIDPNLLENRYLLGDIYKSLGMPEKAISEYEYFKLHSGEKGDVHIKLGMMYDGVGNHEEAVNNFLAATELFPKDADLYYYLGIEYRILKEYEKAISSFHRAVDLGGDNAYFYFNLGVSYERSGKIDAAIIYLDKSVALDNSNAVALNYLGYLLADRGIRLEEAKNLIEKALAVDPENGAYLDSIGWVYFKLYDYSRAREYLERAVQNMDLSEEENYIIFDHLGDTYHKLGMLSEAVDAWEKALELKSVDEIRMKIEQLRKLRDVR